jgi:hypothetical protein
MSSGRKVRDDSLYVSMASKGIEDGAALPHDLYLLNTAQTLKD